MARVARGAIDICRAAAPARTSARRFARPRWGLTDPGYALITHLWNARNATPASAAIDAIMRKKIGLGMLLQ